MNDENPIVMYLIVRESLNMSIGKTAAQVGHAVGLLTLANCELVSNTEPWILWYSWIDSGYRKVVLKADEKEWVKLKSELKSNSSIIDTIIVIDNGLTEIPAGSETVIGIFPMLKSNCPKIVKRLQVLK